MRLPDAVLPLLLLLCAATARGEGAGAPPPSPDAFLGYPLGADRKLADYRQIVEYLKRLDAASDRLTLYDLGKTTLGNTMVMAAISAPGNLERSGEIRAMAARLADPRDLPPAEAERLIRTEPVTVLITCNIHSPEIASSQMAMELAYLLATTEDSILVGELRNVVLLLVPSLNPDGQIMEVEWYRKWLGTPFEGGRMPWLYHPYAGHDNNRDFFMLALPETRMINQVLVRDWCPQIYLDEHQMGSTGPRLFVPPFADPLNPNVPPLVWRLTAMIGSQMALREEQAGKPGVIDRYSYDGYWPGGSMNTTWWKNGVGLLTEAASVKMATPVYVDPDELSGDRKGLPDYREQSNFPNPWRGGWWHLRDIIDYERIASLSLLETAARYRADFLRGEYTLAKEQVEAGRNGPPYAYVVPADQHDPLAAVEMVDILREGGVEAHQSTREISIEGHAWPAGSVFLLMDQPYRAFVKDMLERQAYPEIRPSEGAPIDPPYDVTGWTLPLQMGVACSRIDTALPEEERSSLVKLAGAIAPPPGGREIAQDGRADAEWIAISHRTNAASEAINRLLKAGRTVYLASVPFTADERKFDPGTILTPADPATVAEVRGILRDLPVGAVALGSLSAAGPQGGSLPARRLSAARLGLYKPWTASVDEGWTRLVLERAGFAYQSLDNAAMKGGKLRARFDVIILPSVDRDVIVDGRPKPTDPTVRYFVPLPDEYAGGIGPEGIKALQDFVNEGGTLIAIDASAMLPIQDFNLPVRNALEGVKTDRFSCPGSILRVSIDTTHPVGYGMPAETAAYDAQGPAFTTSVPGAGQDRAVIARFPDEPLVLSGWIRGEDLIRKHAAVVEVTMGRGRIILYGIRVQHRAQSRGTYKLLFNAIQYGASAETPLPGR